MVIQVADQGHGMTDAQLRHALERGWRADPGDGNGRGLGLSIADMLVTSNRGRLLLSSTPGEGLDVRIQFPAVRSGGLVNGDGAVIRRHAH